jgi:hypothetical protein
MSSETSQDALARRVDEIGQYDANIAMYKAIYDSLPHEWPDRLLQFKARKDHHAAIDEVEDMADVELLAQLWYSDQVHNFIRTEMMERTKAVAILRAMQSATMPPAP